MIRMMILVALVAPMFGCGEKEETQPPAANPGLPGLTLTAEPDNALSVTDAKAAVPKDDVVVVGNIRNVVKGFASFQLTDLKLDYCGSGSDSMETCPTPWDYCCLPQNEVNAATLIVEAHDKDGKVRKVEKLSVRHCDLVVVKGKLTKDEHGNVTIVASGWFTRSRPMLHDKVRWPE